MRTPRIRSRLLIPTIQAMFLLYAFLCSISRITDNRHHWWDVMAGSIIGIAFASFTVLIELFQITASAIEIEIIKFSILFFVPRLQCVFLCKNFLTKKITNVEPMLQNGNTIDHRHTSVRRLLSERTKDELNLNHVVVP